MADRKSTPHIFDRLLKDRIVWLGSEVMFFAAVPGGVPAAQPGGSRWWSCSW
jgi:hypothetical protein